MATVYESLVAAKGSLAVKIAEASAETGPTITLDGEVVDRVAYLAGLNEQMAKLNALIQAERPFMIVSRARS